MKIEISPTPVLANVRGAPARMWKGRTDKGVEVVVYVTALQVKNEADTADFERELLETAPPSGICRGCGCTDGAACMTAAGPCRWVDATRTLCSGCA